MGRTPAGQTRERVFQLMRGRLLAGSPPTVREVQQALGFRAVQTAREHLEALGDAGRLTKLSGQARGNRLPGLGDEGADAVAAAISAPAMTPAVLVPLLGRVPAGPLDEAIEDHEDYLTVQTGRAADGVDSLFALRVNGESMRDAGIFDGDIVVVRRRATARSGQIVVAMVGDEATVKRLRLHRDRVELHPENSDFEPIVPRPDDVRLLGTVIEVRRSLS